MKQILGKKQRGISSHADGGKTTTCVFDQLIFGCRKYTTCQKLFISYHMLVSFSWSHRFLGCISGPKSHPESFVMRYFSQDGCVSGIWETEVQKSNFIPFKCTQANRARKLFVSLQNEPVISKCLFHARVTLVLSELEWKSLCDTNKVTRFGLRQTFHNVKPVCFYNTATEIRKSLA